RSPYSTPLPPHSFSFSSCVDHRDLHSFPTRRSSDLLAKSAPNSFDMRVPVTGPGQMAFTRTPFWAASAAVERVRPSIPALAAARSEEHTSELQSPYDLVCRLLLEKKKRTTADYYDHI